MRFCRSCKYVTLGSGRFCNKCGRSYNVRLCPKLHANSVNATACSVCGSRELSTPQRAASMLSRGLTTIALVIGMLLLAATIFYLYQFLRAQLANPNPPLPLMLVGLGLALVWLLFVSPSSGRHKR
jgi:RNA polymerase subunit RPABC4/transcription elongation factor Spt4